VDEDELECLAGALGVFTEDGEVFSCAADV
jgi:hypothetical protein